MDAVTFAPLVAALLLLLISFPVHEAAHATAAWKLGDGHARALGRVSLDPRRHIDPLGAVLLLLSALSGGGMIGWAKPTPVMAQSLRGGSLGWAIVAVAGPLSNLLLAVVAAVLLGETRRKDRVVGEAEQLLLALEPAATDERRVAHHQAAVAVLGEDQVGRFVHHGLQQARRILPRPGAFSQERRQLRIGLAYRLVLAGALAELVPGGEEKPPARQRLATLARQGSG